MAEDASLPSPRVKLGWLQSHNASQHRDMRTRINIYYLRRIIAGQNKESGEKSANRCKLLQFDGFGAIQSHLTTSFFANNAY